MSAGGEGYCRSVECCAYLCGSNFYFWRVECVSVCLYRLCKDSIMLLAWLHRHYTYTRSRSLYVQGWPRPVHALYTRSHTHYTHTQTLTLHSRLTVIMIDLHIHARRSHRAACASLHFSKRRHAGDESSVPSSAATAEEKSGCETSDESGRTLTLRRKIRHGA